MSGLDAVTASRKTKAELIALIYADAPYKGRAWVFGGPEKWTKDELVRYAMHELEPVRPVDGKQA